MTVERVIDLSGLLGPARSQGERSTCLAFAMSDLNRVLSDAPDVLSAEFLYQVAGALTPAWQPGMGLRSTEAIEATRSPGQPLEVHFPYRTTDPSGVGVPIPPAGQDLFKSRISAQGHTMQGVVDELSTGNVVGLVLRVTPGLFTPMAGIVPYETGVVPDAYHAVLAVGWGRELASGVRHLLIRNSWGSSWALSGHAWLPEPFVGLHVIEAFGR